MRQAEVDQYRLARRTKQDAGGFDVMMDDVLPVQVGERGCDPERNLARLFIRQRQLTETAVERRARNTFDHDIGLVRKVAGRLTMRHVNALQFRQDHLLHLETDDGGGIFALRNPRYLHQQGCSDIRPADAPQRRHAAAMNAFAERKAVEDGAGLNHEFRHSLYLPTKRRSASNDGKPFSRMRAAAAS